MNALRFSALHVFPLASMMSLMSILLFGTVLVGWLFFTGYEEKRAARFFEHTRTRLDVWIEHLTLLFQRVDLAHLTRRAALTLAERIVHDLAHLALQVIRFVERLLTRVVVYLRGRRASLPAKTEGGSLFVRTITDFKTGLRGTSARRTTTGKRVIS